MRLLLVGLLLDVDSGDAEWFATLLFLLLLPPMMALPGLLRLESELTLLSIELLRVPLHLSDEEPKEKLSKVPTLALVFDLLIESISFIEQYKW